MNIPNITNDIPRHPTLAYAKRDLAAITHIAIHHTGAPTGIAIANIAAYHVNQHNWPGIGYHFFISANGMTVQVNELTSISYHAGKANGYSAAICLEGDFRNGVEPTPDQMTSCANLCAELCNKLMIQVDNIWGHKQFPMNATECPGDTWDSWGKKLRVMTQERLVKEV